MAGYYIRTRKHKQKMREKLKGRKVTWGDKISKGKKGKIPKCVFTRRSYKGKDNPQWKGGIKKELGYIKIYKPDHPFCDDKGYVRRSRLVMEKHLGRYLKPKEVIHHKGIKYPIGSIENKSDDRIENLVLFPSHSKHTKFENNFRKRDKRGRFIKQFQPKIEWIDKILLKAAILNIPVFMKNNLGYVYKQNYTSYKLTQEFPNV